MSGNDAITIDWEKTPLLPAVAQDSATHKVLMLAYMNEEAYQKTLETGYAHYFSRSRNALWKKGETSGNVQKVHDLLIDCDGDTILVQVEQVGGAACHTGRESCFFTSITQGKVISEPLFNPTEKYGVIDTLYHTLLARKGADPGESYTAKLFSKGENGYLKKVCEEAGEFCFAVKDSNSDEVVYEAADLLYHVLVALADKEIHPDKIKQEIARRFGMSGIEEKNSRNSG